MLEITVDALTKNFGSIRAVDNLSFDVKPGRVAGFIGPNGSDKTTTIRMLLGLVTPSSGEARIGGRRFADLEDPARWGPCSRRARFSPDARLATTCV